MYDAIGCDQGSSSSKPSITQLDTECVETIDEGSSSSSSYYYGGGSSSSNQATTDLHNIWSLLLTQSSPTSGPTGIDETIAVFADIVVLSYKGLFHVSPLLYFYYISCA